MKFIKKHKTLCIVCAIIFMLIILTTILLRELSVDYSKSEYGDRLDGISDVKITKSTISKIEDEISDLDTVSKCNYRLQGRLIYIEIEYNDGVELDSAKETANKVLEYFDEDELAYYDIQFILTNKNDEASGYPEMGYKHKTSDSIVW